MSIESKIHELQRTLPEGVTLVAVSKTYPAEDILQAYRAGQRIFGESRPQEMAAKHEALPADIRWHMIGHLQTNKVKYIAPFVELIHSADSARLLETIDREAAKNGRTIDVLLEMHVAREESKHGWSLAELNDYLGSGAYRRLEHVRFRGVMGIATNTDDMQVVHDEFTQLARCFDRLRHDFFSESFDTLSMGMTSDYPQAVACGSNMVRIGSYIFGSRSY